MTNNWRLLSTATHQLHNAIESKPNPFIDRFSLLPMIQIEYMLTIQRWPTDSFSIPIPLRMGVSRLSLLKWNWSQVNPKTTTDSLLYGWLNELNPSQYYQARIGVAPVWLQCIASSFSSRFYWESRRFFVLPGFILIILLLYDFCSSRQGSNPSRSAERANRRAQPPNYTLAHSSSNHRLGVELYSQIHISWPTIQSKEQDKTTISLFSTKPHRQIEYQSCRLPTRPTVKSQALPSSS